MRSKPFEQELTETLRTVRSLKARVPDEMEDYLHDSIVRSLLKGGKISWGYIYTAVKRRLGFGREAQPYVPLEESIVPSVERVSIDTKLDLHKALSALSERKRTYVIHYFYEGYTLGEIGEKYGVSSARVDQIISKAVHEMRETLTERREDDDV
jgi:RNA polymerase sigma factor (sigma-70 family)